MTALQRFNRILGAAFLVCVWGIALVNVVSPGYLAARFVDRDPSEEATGEMLYTLADADVPLAAPVTANGVSHNGQLSVSGGVLVNAVGEAFQLRGMSSHGIAWYPQYLGEASIRTTKSYGANLFRMAMYADFDAGNYSSDPEDQRKNKEILYAGVENALAADMYAIIDWHVLKVGNPLMRADSAVQFFDEVSSKYADNPAVIYEICNEPNSGTTWADIQAYADRVIPAIRGNAPNALILVGTPQYASDLSASMEAPLPYENVLYTYHHYFGEGSGGYRDTLDAALAAGHPVFVSEWGMGEGDGFDVSAAADFAAYLNAHGISWANWSLSNKDEPFSALRPEVQALGGWTWDDLTAGGKVVFEALGGTQQPST